MFIICPLQVNLVLNEAPKRRWFLIPDILLILLCLRANSPQTWYKVKDLLLVCLQHLAYLERDAVVLYWEEEQCHLGWGLPQYKKWGFRTAQMQKECADTGFIYSSKTAKYSLKCWKKPEVLWLVFPRNNSDKKICSFSWSGHSKWKSNLASKNKQLMLFSVKKILWSWKTLQDVKRNCHSLRGILGSCSIQMVTKYKVWPFKSETLLHSISIEYPTYWWG